MDLMQSGLLARGTPQSAHAMLTFATVTTLAGGDLLATYRAGSTKDSPDETIYFSRSADGGRTWGDPWQPFHPPRVDGQGGSLKLCYLTGGVPGRGGPRLLAAAMWVDRTSHPGQPLFNAETEGCLPMAILIAESLDEGATWSDWRVVPLPDEIGPPSLTSPLLKLANGELALSIETNKHYHDRSKWYQKVVFFHSADGGATWSAPTNAGFDPTGRIFNWDQRCGVAPGGRIGAFLWTYDTEAGRYLNIHRRISHDHGHTWSPAQDLGITDQAGRPAVLPDGRVLLPWVDRFQSHSIRARLAPDIASPFDPASEVVLYSHAQVVKQDEAMGDLLAEMSLWTFGLPYAEALPGGDVLVVYYAGNDKTLDIHWARLRP